MPDPHQQPPAATSALPNQHAGVFIASASVRNMIGGTMPGARNVISGNLGPSVEIILNPFNVVQGNFIGTDVTGTAYLGGGVSIRQSSDNLIGGTTAGARNNIIAGGVGISGVGLSCAHRGNESERRRIGRPPYCRT